jgi:FixJ family two-component response regulator
MAAPAVRVAVVDDDSAVCRALARMLRASGWDARSYHSARAFLDSLGDGRPECLVVDLRMPEMSGLELHDRLVSDGIAIPTILITAFASDATRRQASSAGISACLEKPLGEEALISAIREATAAAARVGPRSNIAPAPAPRREKPDEE